MGERLKKEMSQGLGGTTKGRRLICWAALLCILGVGLALRLPGVKWGFGLDEGAFYQFHPDEWHSCTQAMLKGREWLHSRKNIRARGNQVLCLALGGLAETFLGKKLTREQSVLLGRTASVLAGLLSMVILFLIASMLGGNLAGLLTAFFVATGGMHLITSFWARGQIQSSLFFYAAILFALKSRKGRVAWWLFWAAFMAGAAIGYRWSLSLLPMLLLAALTRRPIWENLLYTAVGGIFGFLAITAFQWSPEQLWQSITEQGRNLTAMKSPVWFYGPFIATWLSVLAGTGLAVFLPAMVKLTGVLKGGLGGLSQAEGSRMKALFHALGSPWALLLIPAAFQLLVISLITVFSARYTDMLPPALAVLAGVGTARLIHKNPRSWWRLALVALICLYQGVYAIGVLTRFTHDNRATMKSNLSRVIPRGARISNASFYIPRALLQRIPGYRVVHFPRADWLLISDFSAYRYLAHSTTLPLFGQPRECRSIWNCRDPKTMKFFQDLYGGRTAYRQVKVYRAAAWTPEMWLYTALMGSKWMFTGDVRVFKRGP